MQQRPWAIYGVVVLATVSAIGAFLLLGAGRHAPVSPLSLPGLQVLSGSPHRDPLATLLIQIVIIVAAARVVGALFQRIGQPSVVGEIAAGLLLGPSLLGWAWPQSQALVFPVDSLQTLRLLAEVGVLLFMFCVGAELDLGQMRRRAAFSLLISHASIALPFTLGVALVLFAYDALIPSGTSVPFVGLALFMGIAMSITAFPVLARILAERGLLATPLGQRALGCAAIDDLSAWCLLAFVLAVAEAGGLSAALRTLTLATSFVVLMLLVVKPVLEKVSRAALQSERERTAFTAGVLVMAFAAAGFTELSGIRPYIGAFLAGVVVPKDHAFLDFMRSRIEPLCTIVLMPLFFAYTGLRTEVGLIDSADDWRLAGLILAAAVFGKVAGATLPARWSGLPWRESLAMGWLMNTRGLMELVVLNIGYDMGLLSPRVFTIMVIMALVTTFMTGPALSLTLRGPRSAPA